MLQDSISFLCTRRLKSHSIIFLSNGDIKLGYTSKPYIINMTTIQMSVLLLFDKSDSLSYIELQEATKLAEDQFPRYNQYECLMVSDLS